jgi:hypothetical protein
MYDRLLLFATVGQTMTWYWQPSLILKWPPMKSYVAYISVCMAHIDYMLVSRPMFSGLMNLLRTVLIRLVYLVKAAILNFKMAANQITGFSISRYAIDT